MLSAIIEELSEELAKPAVYRESDQTIHLPALTVRNVLNVLRWAGDEIAQLTEDYHGASGACVQMTAELMDAEAQIIDLQDQVAEYEHGALLADQRLDYYRAV